MVLLIPIPLRGSCCLLGVSGRGRGRGRDGVLVVEGRKGLMREKYGWSYRNWDSSFLRERSSTGWGPRVVGRNKRLDK